jgi:DNA-binding LacI/PurR family transcriptional regulator
MAKSIYPGLTTIRHPYNEIGDSIIQLLLDQVHDKSGQTLDDDRKKIILTPELVIRDSTKVVAGHSGKTLVSAD